MRVEFKLTQEHIDKGCRNESDNCPLSLCFVETLWIKRARVDPHSTTFYTYNREYYLKQNSDIMMDFITRFDKGEEVKPFTFYLFLPSEYFKLRKDVK